MVAGCSNHRGHVVHWLGGLVGVPQVRWLCDPIHMDGFDCRTDHHTVYRQLCRCPSRTSLSGLSLHSLASCRRCDNFSLAGVLPAGATLYRRNCQFRLTRGRMAGITRLDHAHRSTSWRATRLLLGVLTTVIDRLDHSRDTEFESLTPRLHCGVLT